MIKALKRLEMLAGAKGLVNSLVFLVTPISLEYHGVESSADYKQWIQ